MLVTDLTRPYLLLVWVQASRKRKGGKPIHRFKTDHYAMHSCTQHLRNPTYILAHSSAALVCTLRLATNTWFRSGLRSIESNMSRYLCPMRHILC